MRTTLHILNKQRMPPHFYQISKILNTDKNLPISMLAAASYPSKAV